MYSPGHILKQCRGDVHLFLYQSHYIGIIDCPVQAILPHSSLHGIGHTDIHLKQVSDLPLLSKHTMPGK